MHGYVRAHVASMIYGRGLNTLANNGDNTSDGLETDALRAREINTILVTVGSDQIHCVYGVMYTNRVL